MPYPNEHAARQQAPGQYKEFRRVHPKGFPAGIDAIMGIKGEGANRKSEIQSLRFDSKKWSPEQARKWLKDHGFKTGLEKASGEKQKGLWTGLV